MELYGKANAIIAEASDDKSKQKTFSGYIDEIWRYAMENSDTQLKTAQKPAKPDKKKAAPMLAEDK